MKLRAAVLSFASLLAVAAVLGVQLASGGRDFVVTRVTTECVVPKLPPAATDLETVVEDVVLGGVQRAACTIGVSREQLLISLPSREARADLATSKGKTDADVIAALKAGMVAQTRAMDQAKLLPTTSSLVKDHPDQLGLSGAAAAAVRLVPSDGIDRLLPLGGVIERSIGQLDIDALLAGLGDRNGLEEALRKAVRDAAVEEAKAQLLDAAPHSLSDLFGG
jgi:hypothetical protein